MKTITTHQAKTNLSRMLREVQNGETYTILQGKNPVGKLTAAKSSRAPRRRPPVGTVTSEPIRYDDKTFAPLTKAELKEWGL